jgi:hypothetical protein
MTIRFDQDARTAAALTEGADYLFTPHDPGQ